MSGKTQPQRLVADLATRQHGVVGRNQLRECGVSDAVVDGWSTAGWLHRLYRGVYAVGHRRLTAEGHWMAAVLACAPGAVLTGRAGLALHDVRPIPSGAIDVIVGVSGRRSRPGIRVHRSRHLHPDDRTEIDSIPVTTIERTLLEFAVRTSQGWLQVAVDEAHRRDLLDGRALDALLARNPHHPGAKKLRTTIAGLTDEAPMTRSEPENAFRALVVEYDLPRPQVNVVLHGELVDFYWPQARLVVEVDSYGFHKSRAKFEDDRRKDAKLQVAGERVLRFTDRQIISEPEKSAITTLRFLRT
jgi:very-short-patch-repair endonuclease